MDVVFAKADQILGMISQHSVFWIYAFVLISMTVENLFPPYPGDTIVFVCGAYAAGGHASWSMIYILSVIGTMISVMTLYYIGRTHGRDVFRSNRVRWLGVRRLQQVEKWYDRWHEKLLLLSRWLTGVRALIALFAGVGKVGALRMFFYTLISTLTWNFLVLYLALLLRRDVDKVDAILSAYGGIIAALLFVAGIVLVLRYYYVRRKRTA